MFDLHLYAQAARLPIRHVCEIGVGDPKDCGGRYMLRDEFTVTHHTRPGGEQRVMTIPIVRTPEEAAEVEFPALLADDNNS